MNARIESMSHGDGKVYLQMVLDRMHPDAEVLLDARLKDGAKIPAHLFPFNPLEEISQPIMWWCFLISMCAKST